VFLYFSNSNPTFHSMSHMNQETQMCDTCNNNCTKRVLPLFSPSFLLLSILHSTLVPRRPRTKHRQGEQEVQS